MIIILVNNNVWYIINIVPIVNLLILFNNNVSYILTLSDEPISDEPIDAYLWASLADVETTKCQEKKMLMPPAEYL